MSFALFAPRLLRVLGPQSTPDAFRRATRARVFDQLIAVRLYVAPVLSVVAATFAFFEPTPWRRVVLGVTFACLVVLSIEEAVRARRSRSSNRAVAVNFALMAVGQLAVVLATGGLISPVVIGLLALSLVTTISLGPRFGLTIVLLIQAPTLWALAFVHYYGAPLPSLVPEVFGGAQPFERGPAPWILAAAYSVILLAATRIGAGVRSTFEELHVAAIRERERALAMHEEHGKALTALSAELAHELKNPLASVKGLAALVARDAEGKSAERLGVLRREVDRMQEILEELLTFSRPLVPLSLEEIALEPLAEDVARLFEATSAERGVRVAVRGRGVTLRCDPRKVRQVLVNLVQNAIDASPRGGGVTIDVAATDEGGAIRVLDEGEGLRPEIAERAFDSGVTSKERGSGIGLGVARSLARQHGGDLTLEPGARGCVATLTLPREAAA